MSKPPPAALTSSPRNKQKKTTTTTTTKISEYNNRSVTDARLQPSSTEKSSRHNTNTEEKHSWNTVEHRRETEIDLAAPRRPELLLKRIGTKVVRIASISSHHQPPISTSQRMRFGYLGEAAWIVLERGHRERGLVRERKKSPTVLFQKISNVI